MAQVVFWTLTLPPDQRPFSFADGVGYPRLGTYSDAASAPTNNLPSGSFPGVPNEDIPF